MMKHWLAGAAAFALMTGVAFAQGMSSESSTTTQSTTTTTVPSVGSFNTYENHQSTDTKGNVTDTSKTFQSGAGGTRATSDSKTTAPDGSAQISHEIQTKSPDGGATLSKKTTTTTIER